MPLSERMFAENLAYISIEENAVEEYREQLHLINNILAEQKQFMSFLFDQKISPADKKKVIRNVFSGRIKTSLLSFLMMLVDKNKMIDFNKLVDAFDDVADKLSNTLHIIVTSATPLDKSQVDRLGEKYRQIYNSAAVRVSVRVDKSLIGGLKVKIGNKIIDDSIKTKLENLKEALVSQ